MRTFSHLSPHCSHPEYLDLLHEPNPRREAAAQVGTDFHRCAAEWIAAHVAGQPFFDSGYSPTVRGWLNKLRSFWTPPKGIETEVALGLAEEPGGDKWAPADPPACYVQVKEDPPGSHNYVKDEGELGNVELLTAGRADWLWPDPDGRMVINVVDVKSGQSSLGSPDSVPQIVAQALAAAMRGGYVAARPGIYYARLGVFEWGREIASFESDPWRMVREAAQRDTEPRTGGHCLACWSRNQCDAYARLIA